MLNLFQYSYKLLFCLAVASFAILSENFVKSQQDVSYVMNAVLDTSVHFLIGFGCWLIAAFDGVKNSLLQALMCGIISSAIDVDHFLAAQSFSLKKAISLPNRPILHTVIAIPIFVGICLLISTCLKSKLIAKYFDTTNQFNIIENLHLLLLVAWSSHQLRDSLRRGLWLWPFGSLPPTPFWLYVTSISIFPLFLHILLLKGYTDNPDDTSKQSENVELLDV